MTTAAAFKLCPHLLFVPARMTRYLDVSRGIFELLGKYSWQVNSSSIDEFDLWLDERTRKIFGSYEATGRLVKKDIAKAFGIRGSIGIAPTWILAKLGSEISKPDGLIEVPDGEERAFLAPLPINRLPGIGKKTEQKLNRLGIKTLGQLAAMPPDTLKSHFGASGEILWRYANSIDDRAVEPPGAAKSISRETTFGKDTKDRPFLRATLRYLSERVGADLHQRGKEARSITLKLRYADFSTITRRHTLRQASDTDQTIFNTGLQLLKKALAQEQQPVRLIGIGVSNLV